MVALSILKPPISPDVAETFPEISALVAFSAPARVTLNGAEANVA